MQCRKEVCAEYAGVVSNICRSGPHQRKGIQLELPDGNRCYCLCSAREPAGFADDTGTAAEKNGHDHIIEERSSILSPLAKSSPKELERRLAICAQCPSRTEAPDNALYKIGAALLRPSQNWVCELCGCFLSSKAALQIAQCPRPSDEDPTVSRWGKPYKTASRQAQQAH